MAWAPATAAKKPAVTTSGNFPAPVAINSYPVTIPQLPGTSSAAQASGGGGRAAPLSPQNPDAYATSTGNTVPVGWPGLYQTLMGQPTSQVTVGQPGAYQSVLDEQRNRAINAPGNFQSQGPGQYVRGSSGSSGGGSSKQQPSMMQSVLDSYQQAYEDYLAAVEGRYQDVAKGFSDRYDRGMTSAQDLGNQVTGGFDDRYQRGMANLEGLGTQEKKDTAERYRQLQAANQQDLMSRGLTGTTILPTMNMGVAREQEDAMARINERLQNQRLSLDAALSGDAIGAQERMGGLQMNTDAGLSADLLNFMTARNDIPPDLNQLVQLMQLAGQGGVAGGMGGGQGGNAMNYMRAPQYNGAPYGIPSFLAMNPQSMGIRR